MSISTQGRRVMHRSKPEVCDALTPLSISAMSADFCAAISAISAALQWAASVAVDAAFYISDMPFVKSVTLKMM